LPAAPENSKACGVLALFTSIPFRQRNGIGYSKETWFKSRKNLENKSGPFLTEDNTITRELFRTRLRLHGYNHKRR
jgi:hypothetical protein